MKVHRTFWMLVFGPPLLAVALLAAACVFPLRLDHRSLQHLSIVEGRLPDLAGREVWYLSRGNSAEAGRIAAYTLRHLVFPGGKRRWIILSENLEGPWWGEWTAVDAAGNRFEPGRPPPTLVSAVDRAEFGESTVVVCESREVLPRFLERIPSLLLAREVVFLDELNAPAAIVPAAPRNEFSMIRWWRLTLLLGGLMAVAACCARMLPASRAGFWLGASLGGFAAIAVQLWVLSFGWAWWPVALGIQWVVGAAFVAMRPGSRSKVAPIRGSVIAAVGLAAGVMLAVFLLRLDFDGDVLTHWLPMARSHYHAGVHDPELLLAQGSMHAATYPPGYGSFLAAAMWCAEMDRGRSFSIGSDSSLAIFFYRLAIAALNAALFVALAAYFRLRAGGWLWLAAIALAGGMFDTMRGDHVAAETLLFPMLSAGLLAVAAGGRLGSATAMAVGLWILGVSMIVKWEAVLLVAAIGLPWFVCASGPLRGIGAARIAAIGIAGLLAAVPAIRWKLGLGIDNEFFASPSLAGLWAARTEWAQLFAHGMVIVLKTTLWIPLLVLLPAGVILRLARGVRWLDLLVPAATLALFAALVSIYVFSNWTTKPLHMDQSFDRLLLVPAFSAVLYFLETLAGSGRAAAERGAS